MTKRIVPLALMSLIAVGSSLRSEPPRAQIESQSPIACLAWSAKGDFVAFGCADGTVRVIDAATGKEVKKLGMGDPIAGIAVSPDGKTIAVSQIGQGLSTWDIATGARKMTGGIKNYKADHLAFTSDGLTIVGASSGEFLQWRVNGGGMSGSKSTGVDGGAAVAPDGSMSGWSTGKGQIRLREYDPNRQTQLAVNSADCMAFGPGGKLMALGGRPKEVELWDLTTKQKVTEVSGLPTAAHKLSISADGHTLAALDLDGSSIRVWDLARNNAMRRQISHNRGAAGSLALSPDGKTLATTGLNGKVLLLWNVGTREVSHQGPPTKLSAQELAALWNDLSNANYQKADDAWHKIAAAGDNAVPFLQKEIRPICVPEVDMNKIEKLVAELDSDKFPTRERATKELMAAGEMAIVPLEEVVKKQSSAEAVMRANLVLKKLAQPVLTPERVRVLEVIELLEAMRTAQSIAVLQEISRDARVSQIRAEAERALGRISAGKAANK